MSHYLVKAKLKENLIDELSVKIHNREFERIQPFGKALNYSLKNARTDDDLIVWEEEDYCTPPLKDEREAVLDRYFEIINVEKVKHKEGWERIKNLPYVFAGR